MALVNRHLHWAVEQRGLFSRGQVHILQTIKSDGGKVAVGLHSMHYY